jgi:hypothetical protein
MKEAYSDVSVVGCIPCIQYLYAVFEWPSKVSVTPEEIDVSMDPWLVEDDPLGETRRYFAERKQ